MILSSKLFNISIASHRIFRYKKLQNGSWTKKNVFFNIFRSTIQIRIIQTNFSHRLYLKLAFFMNLKRCSSFLPEKSSRTEWFVAPSLSNARQINCMFAEIMTRMKNSFVRESFAKIHSTFARSVEKSLTENRMRQTREYPLNHPQLSCGFFTPYRASETQLYLNSIYLSTLLPCQTNVVNM